MLVAGVVGCGRQGKKDIQVSCHPLSYGLLVSPEPPLHPLQALLIAALGTCCIFKLHHWVERRCKIDDAVGAVAVHGYSAVFGLIMAGFVLWGYPSSPHPGYAPITPLGQLLGAVIMFFFLGFLPCYVLGFVLKKLGLLRIPLAVELAGMDFLHQEIERRGAHEIIEAEGQVVQKQ